MVNLSVAVALDYAFRALSPAVKATPHSRAANPIGNARTQGFAPTKWKASHAAEAASMYIQRQPFQVWSSGDARRATFLPSNVSDQPRAAISASAAADSYAESHPARLRAVAISCSIDPDGEYGLAVGFCFKLS